MPTYKAKQFDVEKIQEIMRAHPDKKFHIGMKDDWEYVHEEITKPQNNVLGIDSSWWDTPILKIFDKDWNLITEIEVWKEIEFETTEESYKLHEQAVLEMKKRKETKTEEKPNCSSCKAICCKIWFTLNYDRKIDCFSQIEWEKMKKIWEDYDKRARSLSDMENKIRYLCIDDEYLINVIDSPCKYLNNDNECTIHDDENRPNLCKTYGKKFDCIFAQKVFSHLN